MTKVLHVSASAEKGGVETVLLNILKCLDRSRFESEVLFLEDGPFVAEVEDTGTKTHVVHVGRVREVARAVHGIIRTVRLIRTQRIGVVHSHNAKAHMYGGAAASIAGVPGVYHLHGVPKPSITRDGFVSLSSVLTPARRTLACSAYVARAFQQVWHSRREIVVIHNGVTHQVPELKSHSRIREKLGLPDRVPIVLMAARLQRWKGIHVFLEAAAHVVSKHPEVHFVIVGGTLLGLERRYPAELRSQAESLGLTSSVHFVGFQTDVFPYYWAADLVVHSSIEPEPFGMVLVEAMACGKAIIASDCGGPQEIVENGVTGLLVPPDDVHLLAQGMLSLLDDPERRARMGQAGAARVQSRFSARRMAQKLEAVYEDMLKSVYK